MYFTHPQLKFNLANIKKILLALLKKSDEEALKKQLSVYFPNRDFTFTDMGRTAFRLIVEKLCLQNSEMLMPAYICDIFEPIFQEYNITPVFLDIDLNTFNIPLQELKKKITHRTKALLLCHTYGLPNSIKQIKEIIGDKILLIEDFSHSFGAQYNNEYAGNFSDAAFCSSYKQFPCARGGLAVWKNGPGQIALEKTSFTLRDFGSLLNYFPFFSFLFKKFAGEIAPKVVRKEKKQKPSAINRVSLNLFGFFLENFGKGLSKRKEIALSLQKALKNLGFETQKNKGNVFCYLSSLCPKNINRDGFVKTLRKYNVSATRIWHTPIVLNPEVQKRHCVNPENFPCALEASKRIINIPLQDYFSGQDIRKITAALQKTLTNP